MKLTTRRIGGAGYEVVPVVPTKDPKPGPLDLVTVELADGTTIELHDDPDEGSGVEIRALEGTIAIRHNVSNSMRLYVLRAGRIERALRAIDELRATVPPATFLRMAEQIRARLGESL